MSDKTDKKKESNTAVFTCYTFPGHFIIESKFILDSALHIDRKTKKIVIAY